MRVNYSELFTDHHVATLHDWLLETRELYVHVELPHSGGDGRSYLVRSLRDVKQLVSSIAHNEIEIFIYRNLQFPVRGILDDALLKRVLEEIPDGSPYAIVAPEACYPLECEWLGSGDSHRELTSDLKTVEGRRVAVGVDPMDGEKATMEWIYSNPQRVMYFSVKKNTAYCREYAENPERYAEALRNWRER